MIYTYLLFDGSKYKIGKSINPRKRAQDLKTANPLIQLVAYGEGNNEQFLHDKYSMNHFSREWYNLTQSDVSEIKVFFGEKQGKLSDLKCRIPFGKFKGLMLSELISDEHKNYMNWYSNLPDANNFWKVAFTDQLNRLKNLEYKRGKAIRRKEKKKRQKEQVKEWAKAARQHELK